MTDLRACFFCGSPDDVRVVPLLPSVGPDIADGSSNGPGEDPGTVPLCPPCATKLERVVDRVLTAVDAGSGTDGSSPADRTSGGPGASADRSSGGSGAETDDGRYPTHEDDRPGITFEGAGSGGDDGAAEPDADADPDRDRDAAAGEPESNPDRNQKPDRDPTPDPAAGDGPDEADVQSSLDAEAEESAADVDTGERAGSRTEQGDEVNRSGEQGDESKHEDIEDGGDARPIGSVAPDGDDPAPADDAPERAAGIEPPPAEDGPGEDREPVDLDPLTTRRVLRLLQNREFPLGIDAFVDVAATAYELEAATVEAVIELAVDRGLLRREGDRLLQPRPDPEGATGAANTDPDADGDDEAGDPTDDSDT